MRVVRAESERLRESFADVLREQATEASELAAMAGDDEDVRQAVVELLERVEATARTLALDGIEAAAANAARAVAVGDGHAALATLLARCRALDPTAEVLRPVLVIGVSGPSPDPLLRLAPTFGEALADSGADAPLAVLLPAGDLAKLPADAFGRAPRYAWGAPDDLGSRLEAARGGAEGYFAAPLDLRTIGARVRARALSTSAPDPVLLVGASDAVTLAWVRALAGLPAELTALRNRDALLVTLEELGPVLVVLADHRAPELAQVLRGHPDWWDLPRVVVADDAPIGLAELWMPASLPTDRLRAQVMALLERARLEREQRARERSTDVLPRAALLRAAERELAIARRTRQPLTVARIDVDEPGALRRAHGSAALGAALRLLARSLHAVVRATDVVGRVGEHGYGVLLPGATSANVRVRLDEVERGFLSLAAKDPRLAGVTVSHGLADTTSGDEQLFQQAERERLRVRRG